MAEVSEEDLERLANRLAMLASEGGEADNAGRAVSALARRLGLSGGQLKAFFLAGAVGELRGQGRPHRPASPAEQVDRLERELSAMRHGLKLTEVQARNALRERDALRAENGALLTALDRARSAAQVRRFVGMAAVAAVILGGAVIYAGPALRPPVATPSQPPSGAPFLRAGVIHAGGAVLRRVPEIGADEVMRIPGGTRVEVRQVVWRAWMPWSEIEVGGASGFIQSTEIDLP